MPYATQTIIVNTPYETVSELLEKKVELPRLFIGIVRNSKITERGDGYVMREYFQPHPAPLMVTEKIYSERTPEGEKHVFEHVNHPKFEGEFLNILRRIPGEENKCELEFTMDWRPHAGVSDVLSQDMGKTMVHNSISAMKRMAENPPEIPEIISTYFDIVDNKQPDRFSNIVSERVIMRRFNDGEINGLSAFVAANKAGAANIKTSKHHVVQVYQDRGKILVEMFTAYEMQDGVSYLLPIMTSFELDNGKISRVHIFGDSTPLSQGWSN